ncbi:MAG: SUMF1/EgtB/PvdO family nonheme iron enzyme [Candidatus Wallbacteria bacterium]|nr:SUMF1/EgtB/PvdO family nonheme iron enzyme [Candidatus Wallbacteria bacterium]
MVNQSFILLILIPLVLHAGTLSLADGTKFEFVEIKSGQFEMGNYLSSREISAKYGGAAQAYRQEHPRHQVWINGFEIGKYEVTQQQWLSVMGSSFNPCRHAGLNLPAENISYASVEAFIDKLNFLTSSGRLRLPTEAEWEYACLGGQSEDFQYPWKKDEIDPDYCWYFKNSSAETHVVGTRKPNAYGLYDMLGNVWEWCSDYYEPFFYDLCVNLNLTDNPMNSVECGARVLRGGSFQNREDTCRPFYRNQFNEHNRLDNAGFRLARDPEASVEGRDWNKSDLSAPPRSGHSCVVFQDRIWLIAGCDENASPRNDVWSCTDSAGWVMATGEAFFQARSLQSCVTFDNRIWVIGGMSGGTAFNDVWYSSDGVSWFLATGNAQFGSRCCHSSVVFHGRIWVIGGYDPKSGQYQQDSWYSGDGVNWTRATSSAGFGQRSSHQSVVYADRIWVIGGEVGNLQISDVWSSPDGANWNRATLSGFSPRSFHTAVATDEMILVIGGWNGTCLSDIWFSSDGSSWNKSTSAGGHGTYCRRAGVVYKDKIWLIGGTDGIHCSGDLWHSP